LPATALPPALTLSVDSLLLLAVLARMLLSPLRKSLIWVEKSFSDVCSFLMALSWLVNWFALVDNNLSFPARSICVYWLARYCGSILKNDDIILTFCQLMTLRKYPASLGRQGYDTIV